MNIMDNLPIPVTSYNQAGKDSLLNIQAITLWTSEKTFVIEPSYKKSGIATNLLIDRSSGEVEQVSSTQKISQNFKSYYFSAFLGILNLNSKKVVVLVEKVYLVLSIGGRDIFKIAKPIFIFLNPEDKKRMTEEESLILLNVTMLLEGGMYFSYAYKLEDPLSHRADSTGPSSTQVSQRLNFNWASELQKQFRDFDKTWQTSVIQGFVERIEMIINGLKIFIMVISRRCTNRSGTIYSEIGRGVDQDGFTANFVETETVLIVNEYYFSFLQCRGSVPVFWKDRSDYGCINKSINFDGSAEGNSKAFLKHVELIKNRNDKQLSPELKYEKNKEQISSEQNQQQNGILLLNLLNSNSNIERSLINNYELLVRRNFPESKGQRQTKPDTNHLQGQSLQAPSSKVTSEAALKKQGSSTFILRNTSQAPKDVKYAYFDIHTNCKNKNYEPLFDFIEQDLKQILHKYEFSVIRINHAKKKRSILNQQKGIIRSNCMNCLDRTNLAQLSISVYMIRHMLKHIGIVFPEFENGIQFILKDDSFANLYRGLWADNADALSKQYTGTGSTESFAIKKGKLSYLTTIDHGMKSLTRALNSLSNPDEVKNQVISLLTGYREKEQESDSDDIEEIKKEFKE